MTEDKGGYVKFTTFMSTTIAVATVILSSTFAFVEMNTGTANAVQARQDERLNRIEEDIVRIEQYIVNTLNNDAEQSASIDAIESQLEQIQERITRQEQRLNNR